jgi:hypothetical protein
MGDTADIVDAGEVVGVLSLRELGGLLVRGRAAIDAAEAGWLAQLAEFDRRGGWALDGHRDCAGWLAQHCGMAPSTAKDRVRVAHELRRRPMVAAAFAQGGLSYAKVKVLTRMTNLSDDTDEVVVTAAAAGTVADVERMYRHWKLHGEQDTLPAQRAYATRGVQTLSRYDGVATIEVRLRVDDEQRLVAVLDTLVGSQAVDKAPRGALSTDPPTWTQRRADALVDVIEAGLAHINNDSDVDADATTVHVMCDYDVLVQRATGSAELDGGIPISGEAARRLACDAGLVRIITRGASEILDVGRKTRHWTTAQRRAIRYRFGGRCAFPACGRRITQIHHSDPWGSDGETNLDSGIPVCSHHHHLVHEGQWTVAYDPHQRAAIFTSPTNQRVIAPTPGALDLAA